MSDNYPPVKPGSITAVQVIAWIKVGLVSLGVCGMLALSSQMNAQASAEVGGLIGLLVALFGVFLVAYLIIAVNIPKGHNWARIMAIVVEAINLATVPFALANMDATTSGGVIVGVILSIIVIAFAANADSKRYCHEMSA